MKLYKYLILAIGLTMLVSCQDDDDNLEDVRSGKPVATLSTTSVTVEEGEDALFTITLDRAIAATSYFKVYLDNPEDRMMNYAYDTSGSFTSNDDQFGGPGYIVAVPAYQTEATFTVTPLNDYEYTDGPTQYVFRFAGVDTMLSVVDEGSSTFVVNAVESTENVLGFQLDWRNDGLTFNGDIEEGTYLGADGEQHAYADFDFDLYLIDENGNPIDNNMAATGSVPEQASVDLSTLPDGEYTVIVDLYESGSTPSSEFTFPITLKVNKNNAWSYEMDITSFQSTDVGATDGSVSSEVATFEKSGNTITLMDAMDTVLASGRM